MDLDPEKLDKLRRLLGKTSYEVKTFKLHNEKRQQEQEQQQQQQRKQKNVKEYSHKKIKPKNRRISLKIVDSIPNQMTSCKSMEKNTIHNYERQSILRTVLHLTSHTFNGEELGKRSRIDDSRLKISGEGDNDDHDSDDSDHESRSESTIDRSDDYQRKTIGERITCQWETKLCKDDDNRPYYQHRRPCIFPLPLDLADYRPLNAPFVPDLIFCLVNLIEANCYKENWKYMFQSLREYESKAKEYVVKLIQIGNSKRKLKEAIQHLSTPIMIATLRAFLREFRIKPLHLTSRIIRELVKQPLYDQFSRPNKQLRLIIRKSSLCSPRTQIDTLAFLMTHILHACEYAGNQIQGKIMLCNIYGPLLISFSHKPDFVRGNISDDYFFSSHITTYHHHHTTNTTTTSTPSMTPAEINYLERNSGVKSTYHQCVESAILQVIIDVCDLYFWNYIGLFKIQALFMHKTNLERFRQTLLDPYSKLPRRSIRVSRRNKSVFLAPTMIDYEKEIHSPSITSIIDTSLFANEFRKSHKHSQLGSLPLLDRSETQTGSFFSDRKTSGFDEIRLVNFCSPPFKISSSSPPPPIRTSGIISHSTSSTSSPPSSVRSSPSSSSSSSLSPSSSSSSSLMSSGSTSSLLFSLTSENRNYEKWKRKSIKVKSTQHLLKKIHYFRIRTAMKTIHDLKSSKSPSSSTTRTKKRRISTLSYHSYFGETFQNKNAIRTIATGNY